MARNIIGFRASLQSGKGYEAIERATVQQVPSHADGDSTTYGSLSGPAGAVDSDDG